jgi:cyclase
MTKLRVIAVIIIRDGCVVQSEQFKHKHVIHSDAIHAVEMFSSWDIDEIVLLNVSKERESREQFASILTAVSKKCFVPLSVGGFVDSVDYATFLISNGADRLVINTAFYDSPELPNTIAYRYGKQCVIASIDVKTFHNERRVFVDRGRLDTGCLLDKWALHCVENGAGEIFINNIQYDGGRLGYDLESIDIVKHVTNLPIIVFGGASLDDHFLEGFKRGAAAVAAANIFHYKEMATKRVKRHLLSQGLNVREQT